MGLAWRFGGLGVKMIDVWDTFVEIHGIISSSNNLN